MQGVVELDGAGIARDVFVVREDGEFLEVWIRLFEFEKVADDAVAPAAIDDHFGADAHFLRTHVEANDWFFGAEVDGTDLDPFIDRGA